MKRFCGILIITLTILLSMNCIALANEVEIQSASSFSEFGSLLSEMIYSDDAQDIASVKTASDFFLARLIIRTDGTVPEFNAARPIGLISGPRSIYVAQFASASDAEACCGELEAASYVKYVEPDGIIELEKFDVKKLPDENIESYVGNSWGVQTMGAGYVNSYIDDFDPSGSVKVGVIDSGISPHTFIGSRLLSSSYDYVDNDGYPVDEHGHGTHVAGTIIDMTQELNVYVKSYRTLNANGQGYTSASVAAIYQAANDGMDVINMSLGGSRIALRTTTHDAVEYAINSGVTVCIAAGNEDDDTMYYNPAYIDEEGAIVVAAVNQDLSRCYFSNYGTSVDVTAPGRNIVSCYYLGGYASSSGTSMSTPHISGAVAILKFCYPTFSPADMENFLALLCTDLGSNDWDRYFGFGLPILKYAYGKVSMDTYETSMVAGENAQFSASVWPTRIYPITWYSTNNNVLTVDKNGMVTAVGPGTANIYAFHNYGYCNVDVTVTEHEIPTAIEIHGESSIYTGQTTQLSIVTTPEDSDSEVIWSCSNSSTATINANGVVEGIAPGSVTITATYMHDSSIFDTFELDVLPVPATSITLNTNAASIIVGNTTGLIATVLPNEAADKRVTWTTSNASVATVNGSGVVTGLAEGTAIIRAALTANSGIFASCAITVTPIPTVPVTSLHITPDGLDIYSGDSSQLSVAITPENASDKTVTWSSSNTAVATVNAAGLVTAVAPGTAYITCTGNTETNVSDTVAVTVTNRYIPVTSISVAPGSLSILDNVAATLTATVHPANATDKTVTWTSSNTNIVTVNEYGLVTAVAIGSAKIICTAGTETGIKCEVAVTVTTSDLVPVTKVKLSKEKVNVAKNATVKLTAKVAPANATYPELTWTSSDPAIATVNAKGVVKGIMSGSATITATARSGKKDSCVVTVKGKLITSISLNKTKYVLSINLGESLGKTYQLKATFKPAKADNKNLKWKSSNKKVATVDENGLITSVGFGKCTITATAQDGSGKKAKCVVTVAAKKVSSITITGKKNMVKGIEQQLTIDIAPKKAYNQSVKWKSSNTSIATVDENGVVTALKKGKVTITATAKDGSKKKGVFKITIKNAK